MKFIDGWKRAWKFLSIQVALVAVIWGSLPADVQANTLAFFSVAPERVPAVLGVLMILARLLAQPSIHDEADPKEP
jgi:hypothetical protein